MTEKMMRWGVGADKENPGLIFSFRKFFATINADASGKYTEALENLRLAPSAVTSSLGAFCGMPNGIFFIFIFPAILSINPCGTFLQNIDMGIAMCHFALTAQENKLNGKWQIDATAPKEKSLDYICTWQGEN